MLRKPINKYAVHNLHILTMLDLSEDITLSFAATATDMGGDAIGPKRLNNARKFTKIFGYLLFVPR